MACTRAWTLLIAALMVVACAPRVERSPAPLACGAEGNLTFVCGAERPEDLAAIPGTPWIVASGFAPGAGLKLVDTRSRSMRRWFTGATAQVALDDDRYPDCAGPPDPALFNARGLTFRQLEPGTGRLHVVNHGGRESVEVFAVSWSDPSSEPELRWQGCLLLPARHVGNSVATYTDGTVLVTVLTRPGTTITDFVRGQKTGLVLERPPGAPDFSPIRGTELEGNNGLETARDDDGFYVVAFGAREIVRFDRDRTTGPSWSVIAPGFMPDNIHRDGDRLLTAGMMQDEPACGGVRRIVDGVADSMLCHRGYVAATLDPKTRGWTVLAYGEPSREFNGVSAALIAGNDLWLGSYQADRLAFRALPAMPIEAGAK